MSFSSHFAQLPGSHPRAIFKAALNLIYPPQCIACHGLVETEQSLCGECWRDASFIHGLACRKCGAPLPGDDSVEAHCDDCMMTARPWGRGYAAMVYHGTGRRVVLSLKHGDRTELAEPAGRWIAAKLGARHDISDVIPVPLHRKRFVKRRYNQSALIAKTVANILGVRFSPDALQRTTYTDILDGKTKDARFQTLTNAILVSPKFDMARKRVLVIDDVMTSGATLAACTEACITAGAHDVDVAVLARVVKDL